MGSITIYASYILLFGVCVEQFIETAIVLKDYYRFSPPPNPDLGFCLWFHKNYCTSVKVDQGVYLVLLFDRRD